MERRGAVNELLLMERLGKWRLLLRRRIGAGVSQMLLLTVGLEWGLLFEGGLGVCIRLLPLCLELTSCRRRAIRGLTRRCGGVVERLGAARLPLFLFNFAEAPRGGKRLAPQCFYLFVSH